MNDVGGPCATTPPRAPILASLGFAITGFLALAGAIFLRQQLNQQDAELNRQLADSRR